MPTTFVTLTTSASPTSVWSTYLVANRSLASVPGTGSQFVGTGIYSKTLATVANAGNGFQIYKEYKLGNKADAGSQFTFFSGNIRTVAEPQSEFRFNTFFQTLSTPADSGSVFSRNNIVNLTLSSPGDSEVALHASPEFQTLETEAEPESNFEWQGAKYDDISIEGRPQSAFSRFGSVYHVLLSTVANYESRFGTGEFETLESAATYTSEFRIENWEELTSVAVYNSDFMAVKVAPLATTADPGSLFGFAGTTHKSVEIAEEALGGFAYYVL